MSIRFASVVFIIACIGCLSGCATIFSKSKYPVSINSSPTDVRFTIVDKSGDVIFTGRTPNMITLKAGFITPARYKVIFEAEGYDEATLAINTGVSKWVLANVFFGPAGIGTLIIDSLTGSMYTLPEHVSTSLKPALPPTSSRRYNKYLQILSLDDVPVHLFSHLIRIDR